MPKPAANLAKLPEYLFAEIDKKIDAAKARGVDIISLGVGDPDLPTPKLIVDAMAEAIKDKETHNYPPYKGTKDYLQAAASWMKTRFGVDINPDNEALALIGSKEGLAHLILAYIDTGDVVLCPSPGYPVYNNYTLLCGGEPYVVPLLAKNKFLPDVTKIPEDIAKRAKLFFLNYPNNPTGAIIDEAKIAEVVAFCKKYDILLCHDNAYSEMTFDGYKAPSFLSSPGAKDITIEMFSLSKMYNMTGWRVGFAVGNPEAIKTLGTIKNNTDSGVFKAIQRASAAGLLHSEELTKDLNAIYAKRRDIFVEGLKKMGWPIESNEATFYLWAPVPTGMTSVEFVSLLLEKCGIVCPPGTGYGPEGEGFFRVALTIGEERLREALKRMEDNGVTYTQLSKAATPA
ncbi:MAG: LL-diaminopimelate aminotransferase [Vampirovibrionales bacterium]|nr:LL-diaminopimelate aminotransferase [Vampirovibrionales bacterium]